MVDPPPPPQSQPSSTARGKRRERSDSLHQSTTGCAVGEPPSARRLPPSNGTSPRRGSGTSAANGADTRARASSSRESMDLTAAGESEMDMAHWRSAFAPTEYGEYARFSIGSASGIGGIGSMASMASTASTGNSVMSGIKKRQRVVEGTIRRGGFQYLRTLKGHRSCVNTLAFSNGAGRWLASAGDDLRIHIRDVLTDVDSCDIHPLVQFGGHRSNIFSLAWSCDNRHLFSGSNDEQVLHYDLSYSPLPLRSHPRSSTPTATASPSSIATHEDSVREISAHPTNPSLVLSCCDNGELQLHDIRASGGNAHVGGGRGAERNGYAHGHGMMDRRAVVGSRLTHASFSGVQWNPNGNDGNTFAAATMSANKGSTRLYDVRYCFRETDASLSASDALIDYATILQRKDVKRGLLSTRAETSSLQFDPDGRFLATNVSLFKPTIYAVGDPLPLLVCSSTSLSPHAVTAAATAPSEPSCSCGSSGPASASLTKRTPGAASAGYHNSCTVKHGSFGRFGSGGSGSGGGGEGLYYVTGSDDFRAYGWKVPEDVQELRERREQRVWNEWLESEPEGTGEEAVYYVQHRPERVAVRPLELDTPAFTLEGARSITNVALCHPTLPYIATSGIERIVRLYSSIPLSSSDLDPKRPRPTTRTRMRIRNSAAVARALIRGPIVADWDDEFGFWEQGRSGSEGWEEEGEEGEEEEEEEEDESGDEDGEDGESDDAGIGREEEDGEDSESDEDDEDEDDTSHEHEQEPNLIRTPPRARRHHPSHAHAHDEAGDEEAIALFDELLREDEGRRLFDGRGDVLGWGEPDEEHDGEDEDDGSDQDEGEGQGQGQGREGRANMETDVEIVD